MKGFLHGCKSISKSTHSFSLSMNFLKIYFFFYIHKDIISTLKLDSMNICGIQLWHLKHYSFKKKILKPLHKTKQWLGQSKSTGILFLFNTRGFCQLRYLDNTYAHRKEWMTRTILCCLNANSLTPSWKHDWFSNSLCDFHSQPRLCQLLPILQPLNANTTFSDNPNTSPF